MSSFLRGSLSPPQNTNNACACAQENTVWEGGAYARVAVAVPDVDGSVEAAVNITLAVALSLSLVALIVVAGVAAKHIQRKVRYP